MPLKIILQLSQKKEHLNIKIFKTILLACAILIGVMCSCRGGQSVESVNENDSIYRLPDTLRVGTLYSPTSYFIYREEKMGYDYDLINRFVSDKALVLDLIVATSMNTMIEMLDSGQIDVIAYEIPITAEFKSRVLPCGIENITHQVLVQPRNMGKEPITDVTQLVGKDVYVEKASKYQHRLENLNDELGGGINIYPIDRDTLITEDLIAMVSEDKIPLTIVDSDIAKLNKTYYGDLDITLEVSFPQRASWAVSRNKPWLADSINQWVKGEQPQRTQASLLKRYFELSKNEPSVANYKFEGNRISPYDELFKRYAATIGWDWRLLAAQGFTESRFDTTVVSWAGARGIMQIMPSTARAFGLDANRIANPEANIATAVEIIKSLNKSLIKYVPDENERKKFIIGAYNSGIAHVYDAIALAKKYGKNPQIWDGNVAETILMKSKPEFYNDSVCKYGYFRGRQTVSYVAQVINFYERSLKEIK